MYIHCGQMINELLKYITPFHCQCLIQIGGTPLHYASESGNTDVVELLIDHDAHIDVPTMVHRSTSYYSSLYSPVY